MGFNNKLKDNVGWISGQVTIFTVFSGIFDLKKLYSQAYYNCMHVNGTKSPPDLTFCVVAQSVAVNNAFGRISLFAFVPSIIKAFVLENLEKQTPKDVSNYDI